MITVSNDFKTAMKAPTRQMYAYILYDETEKIEENDGLAMVKLTTEGDFNRSVMRKLDAEYFGDHSLLGKWVKVFIGVNVSGSPEYIDYGSFYVHKVSYNRDTERTSIEAYDLMRETLKLYNMGAVAYPTTLFDYVEAMAGIIGVELATTSFTNDDLVIDADPFALSGSRYRDVLEQVAEASASIIYINNEDELAVRNVSTVLDDTLTTSDLFELDIEEQWGGVNGIRVSYVPIERNFFYIGGYDLQYILQENGDSILQEDESEIAQEILEEVDELYQIHFANNEFLRPDPDTYLSAIGTIFTGLTLHPFQATTGGYGWYEIGDRIKLIDRSSTEYESTITKIELTLSDSGFKEVLSCAIPEKSRTKYIENSGVIDNMVSRIEIDGANLRDDSVTSAKVSSLTADKIETGTLGVSTRIIVRDEENDRVLIGTF